MLNVYVVTEKVKITPDTDTTYFAAYQKKSGHMSSLLGANFPFLGR